MCINFLITRRCHTDYTICQYVCVPSHNVDYTCIMSHKVAVMAFYRRNRRDYQPLLRLPRLLGLWLTGYTHTHTQTHTHTHTHTQIHTHTAIRVMADRKACRRCPDSRVECQRVFSWNSGACRFTCTHTLSFPCACAHTPTDVHIWKNRYSDRSVYRCIDICRQSALREMRCFQCGELNADTGCGRNGWR